MKMIFLEVMQKYTTDNGITKSSKYTYTQYKQDGH